MSSAYEIVMENRREIVERLISQMEKGYAQTRAAWNSVHTGRPYNPVSNAVYKGGNRLRLMIAAQEQEFSDPRWLTFKQASEQNYRVMSGAKGVLLEKWIFYKDVPKLDEAGKSVIDTDGKPVIERIIYDKPIVNYFRVFNGSQIIGLPELERTEVTEDVYSKMADTFERSSMCPISYEMQDRAYYSSKEDKIHLPPKESFKNNETRLSVLLHEMAHSTGHESRLNRPLGNGFGSEAYAKEELNAELSSVFLENELCISMEPDSEMLKDHANYVKSWLSVLKENPNELFVACATAEHITEYLMGNYGKELEKSMEEMKTNQLTLEERYTEAMKIAGYERIPIDEGELATVAFKNMENGETVRMDGWQSVGEYVNEISFPEDMDKAKFENLIHPEGRMEYYLKIPSTELPLEPPAIEKYKNLEEAYKAYQEAGFANGKTLGYLVEGGKPVDLVWYDSRSMSNDLFRLSKPPMSYAFDLTVNELDELGRNARQMLNSLQKENACIQLANAVTDVEMKMVSVIEHGDLDRVNEVAGRFVSERRPQDYLDITVSDGGGAYDPADESPDNNKELKIKLVHANEVIDCKVINVKMSRIMENGMQEFANQREGVADWLQESIAKLDTDFMPYGQPSFTFYSTFGMASLEDHYEKLENAGYERFPSDRVEALGTAIGRVYVNYSRYYYGENMSFEESSIKAMQDENFEFVSDSAEVGGMLFYNKDLNVSLYIDYDVENERMRINGFPEPDEELGFEELHPELYEQQLEAKLEKVRETRITADISESGFRPEKSLVKNISRFEVLSEKKYTMRELAELNKQKHGLTGERKECFQKIVAECQNQEQEHGHMQERAGLEEMKQQNFLKQQMQMEQMAMIQG